MNELPQGGHNPSNNLLTSNSLPVREEAKMRKDADANHIHEHVQVQDEMEESVTGHHSLAYMVLLGFKSLQC
jgi:hypothetical protein